MVIVAAEVVDDLAEAADRGACQLAPRSPVSLRGRGFENPATGSVGNSARIEPAWGGRNGSARI